MAEPALMFYGGTSTTTTPYPTGHACRMCGVSCNGQGTGCYSEGGFNINLADGFIDFEPYRSRREIAMEAMLQRLKRESLISTIPNWLIE